MKVILLESIGTLGAAGDIVKVRPGHARNLLIPRGKAIPADERSMKAHAHRQKVLEHKLKKLRKASEEMRKTLEGKGVTIKRRAGEHEKLFGSVTAMDIEEALRAEGVIVSRRSIRMDEPIKKTGDYSIPVKLDGGLEVNITVHVSGDKA